MLGCLVFKNGSDALVIAKVGNSSQFFDFKPACPIARIQQYNVVVGWTLAPRANASRRQRLW